jgi:hypothetical protein
VIRAGIELERRLPIDVRALWDTAAPVLVRRGKLRTQLRCFLLAVTCQDLANIARPQRLGPPGAQRQATAKDEDRLRRSIQMALHLGWVSSADELWELFGLDQLVPAWRKKRKFTKKGRA